MSGGVYDACMIDGTLRACVRACVGLLAKKRGECIHRPLPVAFFLECTRIGKGGAYLLTCLCCQQTRIRLPLCGPLLYSISFFLAETIDGDQRPTDRLVLALRDLRVHDLECEKLAESNKSHKSGSER